MNYKWFLWCFWVFENWVKNHELEIKSMLWCVLNVPFNCINFGWCLYNDFGKNEMRNVILGKFWEGFLRSNPFFGFPGTRSSLDEQVSCCGEMCRTTHVVLCVPPFWGCFRTSLSVPYVMFCCCFDEFKLCNHACLKLNELWHFEMNFDHNINMILE